MNVWQENRKYCIASTLFVNMNGAFINVGAINSGSLSHNSVESVIAFCFSNAAGSFVKSF